MAAGPWQGRSVPGSTLAAGVPRDGEVGAEALVQAGWRHDGPITTAAGAAVRAAGARVRAVSTFSARSGT